MFRFCAIWLLAEPRSLELAFYLKGSHNEISLTNMASFYFVLSTPSTIFKHTLYLKNKPINSSLILLKLSSNIHIPFEIIIAKNYELLSLLVWFCLGISKTEIVLHVGLSC